MVKVKYIGRKPGGMPVQFPIGANRRSSFKEIKRANPFLELSEADAEKLIQLNPHGCFVYAGELDEVAQGSIPEAAPKKRGRKPKSQEA